MASIKQESLGIALLVAIDAGAPSSLLRLRAKRPGSETGAEPSDAAQRPPPRETHPIPQVDPLAQPKSLDQVGLPAGLTR
jgi:hypothetical protein